MLKRSNARSHIYERGHDGECVPNPLIPLFQRIYDTLGTKTQYKLLWMFFLLTLNLIQ